MSASAVKCGISTALTDLLASVVEGVVQKLWTIFVLFLCHKAINRFTTVNHHVLSAKSGDLL